MIRRYWTPMAGLAVCLLPLVAAAAEPGEIAGVWRLKTSFRSRTIISMLRFSREDGAVKGVLMRRPGQETALGDLRYANGNIEFTTSRRRRGNETSVVSYSGKLTGDTIEGTTTFRIGSETREWKWSAERSSPAALRSQETGPPVQADIALGWETYSTWRDHILPAEAELEWQKIPWQVTFKDGILLANETEKPLLLWTMNGHPLGCT